MNTSFTILKEINSKSSNIILEVQLDNQVTLFVRSNGSALGSDGKEYHAIIKESDDDSEIIGWSSEIDKELIV